MKKTSLVYAATFYTTKNIKRTKVWGACLTNIENDKCNFASSINEFFENIIKINNSIIIYFRNLKVAGEFIVYYLLKNNYELKSNLKDITSNSFYTLISGSGEYYKIVVLFKKKGHHTIKAEFRSIENLVPLDKEETMRAFNISWDLPSNNININEDKPDNYTISDYEKDALMVDTLVETFILKDLFNLSITSLTVGASSFNKWASSISNYRNYYPALDIYIDDFIRGSYKGGWCYLNESFRGKKLQNGLIVDKNSMYPSIMLNEKLPYGEPLWFTGEYQKNSMYPLYIQNLTCTFKLKKGKFPTIQLKHVVGYTENTYLETSDDKLLTLTLTSVDLDLFTSSYDVSNITYQGGLMFKSIIGLFNNYINTIYDKKIEATINKNYSERTIYKLLLNSLFGKFGTNPHMRNKTPYLKDDIVHYKLEDEMTSEPKYTAVSSFVTSYARREIITLANKINEYSLKKYKKQGFVYADTDSLHIVNLSEEEVKDFIPIDNLKIGYYKIEHHFNKACYLKLKCYLISENGEIISTVGGLPKHLKKYLNFDNFRKNFAILADDNQNKDTKENLVHVKGGVIHKATNFTIH